MNKCLLKSDNEKRILFISDDVIPKTRPDETFRKICIRHFRILKHEYLADVTEDDVTRTIAIFIEKMRDRLVIGGPYIVSLQEILEASKHGQNGFSDKIDLILWIFLLQIRKEGGRDIPTLGMVKIKYKKKELFVCVDLDLDGFYN